MTRDSAHAVTPNEARTRLAHAMVDTMVGLGLSLGSAFRVVGMMLDEVEREEGVPVTATLHLTRREGLPPVVFVRHETR